MRATGVRRALALGSTALLAAGGAGGAAARSDHGAKRCGAGFIDTVVRGRHICRAAADLRVAVAGSPEANRVGGSFTFTVTVANAGRRSAPRVVLTADVPGELVSASPTTGTCDTTSTAPRSTCQVGALAPSARVTVSFVVRGTAVGPLRASVRASSPVRDVRPKDNAAAATRRVTEPDSVRGRGVRPTAGGGPRPPVTIEVDAISGPHGDDPTGTFWTKYPSLELRGRVVCLTVSGNRASVGGIVEETSSPATNPVGSAVHLGITDNGEPGAGRDLEVTYLQMQAGTICPVPLQETPEIQLIDGNFVVHDEA
jgi:hypothetical protein